MSNRYLTTGEASGQDDVHSITATAESHTHDMGHRMKVYSVQMGLRIVCLLVFVAVDHFWVRAVALLGVAVLPWMAVMLANSGADRSERRTQSYEPPAVPAPGTGPARELPAGSPEAEVVLEGEFTPGHGGTGPASPPAPGATAPSGPPGSSARVEGDPPGTGGAGPSRS